MYKFFTILFLLVNCLTIVLCGIPVVNILSEAECTTYVLVHNVLEIEWFASSLLNCTVHVETIRTITEYDYICITPKQLYFPNCVAKATVFEDSYTNKVMTRNCFNRLDPTFCTAGSRPLIIRFEAKQKSSAHVVFRVEGRNGQYTSNAEEDDDDSVNEGLTTQIVLAVGSITTFLAIVVCIFLSCRHSRYRNCDSSSERSSPRTIQTEDGDGEIAGQASVPELDSLINNSNRQTDSIISQEDKRNTPPPSYWEVVEPEPADSAVK